ncbi:hypothetical protein SU69_04525 [Thermosipho melanesiensis]|uniref:DUF218 domain-containing protein n=2 Tax=Thermosipho melanesiensis TaxID=46541 RepID=A6LLE6_THEM4|nr:YdcF family protein [Thermosipho melanesiensis]ABR30747.1 protein of unknown function DUF218 [Thermosipho melanesiensis BI429]APT73870.1 hypothetical protein BW47_04760 [Thermosipho melanesiensis]OOC35812.1 hypothetical protein SU68_04580 [Thermosipho melanesiensis]OOC38314.1 hypothetical protein SU69_04525 [Thermosipho melanesiensis]OOC38775.1 hypothetical protein SU70_04525 [Thermosipho melanesiensis]
MIYIYKTVGSMVQFPGILILLFFIISIYFLIKKRHIWRFFIILSITLYVISTPIFNFFISKLFIVDTKPIPKDGTIVVLGGGIVNYANNIEIGTHTLKRLLKGWEIYKEKRLKIVVAGGVIGDGIREADVMKDFLIKLGVSKDDIITENTSRTTKENAKNVSKITKDPNIILVTSFLHMKRAKMLFEKYTQSNIIPVVCDYPIDLRKNFLDFLPSPRGIYTFSLITHEFLGILKGG